MKRKIVTETHGSAKDRQALFSAAGRNAVRELQNASIPITYASGTEIIREYSDGKKEVIGSVPEDIVATKRRIKLS